MKTLKPILYIFLITSIFSCKEANPIIELPPVEEEIISSDTYCVVEEEPITYEDTFYTHNTGGQEHGFATAIKLNKEWEGSAYAKFHNDYFYLFFNTYNSTNSTYFDLRESFSFKLAAVNTECYVGAEAIEDEWSEPHAKFSYGTQVGDVGGDSYQLYTEDTKGNYLEIDSLNLETNYISGYFMAGFNNVDSNPKEWNPNYVRFLNGRFECTIID